MYQLIELLAVIASAFYGVLLARRNNLDFVGVFCMAFIVSFGGGTLRDLMLDRHPLFWMKESHYPVVVFVISMITSLLPRIPDKTERILSLPDAIGLGLFTIAGTNAAIESGTSFFIASLLGAVTGTFGGVMGDVICNKVPSLFRQDAPMFATCSFTGSWIFLLLREWPLLSDYAAPIAIIFIVLFRLAALQFRWFLPHITLKGNSDDSEQ